MRHDLLKASTKYNDLLGSAAADRADYPDPPTFEKLFQEAGLDLDVYYPIAYSFSIPEETYFPDRDKMPHCYLIAHCVLRAEVGEDVEAAADPGLGLPIYRFHIETTPQQFLRLFKRLQITFMRSKGDFKNYHANSYAENIQEERFLPEDA